MNRGRTPTNIVRSQVNCYRRLKQHFTLSIINGLQKKTTLQKALQGG